MKISLQRLLFELANFLMAFLFVIPIGVLAEQLCHFPLYSCCFIPCLSMIGFLLGRISMTRNMVLAMILSGVSLIAAVVLGIVLSPSGLLITVLMALISGFFSVFSFFSARKAAYTIYAPMAIGGILIHLFVLLCCAGFEWDQSVSTFTSGIAVAFFLLTLFAFSAKGLRKSLHKGSSDKRVTYPAGMQMGNFLLVAGFIIIASFISNIYPIFVLFSNAFGYVLKMLLAAFGFFISLFDRRGVATDVEEGVSQEAAADSILNAEPKGEAAWVTTSVEIFAFILVLLLFGYFAVRIAIRMRNAGLKMPAFIRNLRDKFMPVTEEDFTDETENLFDLKQMLSDTGARLRNSLQKLREKPQKIDDFEDDRMKIRFAFQQMLKKVTVRTPGSDCKTPNEIYAAEYKGEDDFREFIDYYNSARYSDHPVTEDAVDSARAILKQKL